MVDDPYTFGQVAAANALSDIYAMGASPVFALNFVAFPVRSLPLGYLEAILKGGADKAHEAGVEIVGGHSIEDPAPKYGLSVTGFARPDQLVTKAGALPGDHLVLTKPLGSGILTTALDKGLAGPRVTELVVPVMTMLNRDAAHVMTATGVHACTDITGFGLLGHLHELARRSGMEAVLDARQVPVLPGTRELAARGAVPNGTHNNLRFLQPWVDWGSGVEREDQILLCDAQTSGGLLMAVPPDRVEGLVTALREAGCLAWADIGHLVPGRPGHIQVRHG